MIELIIMLLVGIGAGVSANEVYSRLKNWKSPSDTDLMMSTIKVASRVAKKDPKKAQKMIAGMKASLLADAEFREDDLNGLINDLVANETATAEDVKFLRKYYRQKKQSVDERRRRLGEEINRGKRPGDF